jgi:heme A synthase
VIACVALQLTAGAINLLLLAPVGMQLLHLALADVLWIALVMLCAAAPEWPDRAPERPPVSLSHESIRG